MKKLLMTVVLGVLSCGVNAGWFSDTYYEQGYDRGVEVGFGWTACSRSGVGKQVHFMEMKDKTDYSAGFEYFIKGNKVDKKIYNEFMRGYEKGTKFGKTKCNIK